MKNKLKQGVVILNAMFLFSIAAHSKEVDVYKTSSGLCFEVQEVFKPSIKRLISEIRTKLEAQIEAGKFVAYLSVPISGRGGGHFQTNVEIAKHTAVRLRAKFGNMLWVLNPAEYNLGGIQGKRAGGGDYMAVWGDVLGGIKGSGASFDIVYFLGPRDVWSFFGSNGIGVLNHISDWAAQRSKVDKKFADFISNQENRKKFLRFYGLRAATTFSKGASDEWNLFQQLNSSREIGEDIAIYFDGNAVEISDFSDHTKAGYAVNCR